MRHNSGMWEQIKLFLAMGEHCVKEGVAHAPCRDYFWLAGLAAVIAIVVVGVLAVALRQWRLRSMRRASKELTLEYLDAQRRVANEMTMERVKWKGDATVATGKEQSEVAMEIREALQTRKING